MGLPPDDRALLRRAAMVHDLGAIGITTSLWDKRGPLSAADGERMRTHPYLAERTLARAPALAPIGALAARHHERLDGSGYPRGLSDDAIGPAARVLAAADVYHALTEERPTARRCRQPTPSGRCGRRCERAGSTGTPSTPCSGRPATACADGPSARAASPRGRSRFWSCSPGARSNPEIAAQLVVSPKTVGSHIEHIYTRLGVSSRIQAALFAMRHGLLPD